jgi:cytochrome bd ubiquinol oxidase subunit I
MGPSGFVAVIAGWITTEAGRQPYVVYGLMRTAEAASPIAAAGVQASLTAFVLIYLLVFASGIYFLVRLMAREPKEDEPDLSKNVPLRAAGITPIPQQL